MDASFSRIEFREPAGYPEPWNTVCSSLVTRHPLLRLLKIHKESPMINALGLFTLVLAVGLGVEIERASREICKAIRELAEAVRTRK